MDETLLTAARRIVRFVRVDDASHGGLLRRDTIHAAQILDQQIKLAESEPNPSVEEAADARG
jgi:hypothetical protein